MATFKIHEDIENMEAVCRKIDKKQAFMEVLENNQEKKIFEKYTDNNIFQKKCFLDNKAIVQSQKCMVVDFEQSDASEKYQKKQQPECVVKEPFLKIEKENAIVTSKEEEKEGFSLSLLHNIEYREEIWKYLQDLEMKLPPPKPGFMAKQSEINWESRSILVDWLASVSEEYQFCDETFHLGVNYIDIFLSRISVARNKFQLVGSAAMMVAAKMEEYYPIDAKEWSYLTGDTFPTRQVLKMEQVILKVLNFRMQVPTINVFIKQLATEQKMDKKTLHLAMYIAELVLLEGGDYLEYVPSKVASACIALARYTLRKPTTWPMKLKKISGYSLKELSPVIQRQHKTLKASPMKQQQAIQTKYKSDKYNKVALTKTRTILFRDFDAE